VHNFYDQFAAAAQRHADRIAVEVQRQDGLESITYGRLREMAERTAAWLAVIGIAPGDRCAILADNDGHWCAAYLGVLRRGAIAVPLDTAYKAYQIETLLRDSAARVFFTTLKYLDTVRTARAAVAAECRLVLLHGSADETTSFDGMVGGLTPAPPLPACPATPQDPAVILYTSGTTSDPKGVVLTHANLLAERAGAFEVVHLDEHDCILGVLPLFHALAQMANLLLPFSIGARVVFLESVNTTELLRALRERGVTAFACVPQFFYLIHQRVTAEVAKAGGIARRMFALLMAANGIARRVGVNAGPLLFRRVHALLGGRIRLLVTGASRFDPDIGRDLYCLGFNILQAYGLTETSGAATLMRPGDPDLDTVGPPLPGVEIRIAPATGGDAERPEDGEVLIRGGVVMQGYFNRPDATAQALRDGWLYTGDLGHLDDRGRLTITGRSKELIVLSSGKNIYPEEIEAVYRKPAVIKEICVLGLARPGEPAAERLYAVVVPDEQVLRDRKVANVGDLLRFEMEGASVHLPAHKRVLGYEIWMEPLPRTSTGKLKRFEIERRVHASAQAKAAPGGPVIDDADRAWLSQEDIAPLLDVIRAAARPGAVVTPDANLELDLGLDSMERVELLTALERRAGSEVPEAEMQQTYTVRALIDVLLTHRVGKGEAEAGTPWGALLSPEASDDAALGAALQAHRVVPGLIFFALKTLRLLLRPGVRVEVTGLEHLPSKGPYLICPNHQSYLDPFIVIAALPHSVAGQLFFVGATEYFETSLLRWLARQVSLVPVDPDASLVSAMQAGAYGLRQGRILLLFPEGERAIDGRVRHFKKGAAILAHHMRVPIVPVALQGLYDVWPRNRPLHWRALRPGAGTVVRLTVGAPLQDEPHDAESTDEPRYDAITARLRGQVEQMWNTSMASVERPATSPR
jgi:long-chain acyl-CoA synthetase